VGALQGVLAGACLVGVVLTVGTLLLTRSNSVTERRAGGTGAPQLAAATSLTGPISFIGVPRRKLGLRAADPDPAVVRASGYAGGAVVSAVEPDSEAEAVGLEVGDLVVAVDGDAVIDAQGLADRVAAQPSGTTAVFDVLHDGRVVHVTIIIP
jgi:S1-C subfamily serine protease